MDRTKNQANINIFFTLVRIGLWADVETSDLGIQGFTESVDWEGVYQLAEEQSVIGVVLAGIEHSNVKPPKELLLQWIGEVQILEQQNKSMNQFIGDLIKKMRTADIYTLLVKGQGLAQCYDQPLWRACGDVDLLLSDTNYNKAKLFLAPKSTSTISELKKEKHIAYIIDGWCVELHGNLPSRLFKSIDRVIVELERGIFYGGQVKSLMMNNTEVFTPAPDLDVLFVFTHLLKHFFRGGVGFRQICDWCRLLWTYRDCLKYGQLESRIQRAGLMSEWKTFAALVVNYLGMPAEAMPFYSASAKWKRKASKVVPLILKSGNFGNKRDKSYYSKYPYLLWKTISLWNHTRECLMYMRVFPVDAVKIWGLKFSEGFVELFQKEE